MELKVLVIKCTKFFITIQLNLNIGIWVSLLCYTFRFRIPDSRFRIPDFRFQIPDSKFQIPDSKFQIPDYSFLIHKPVAELVEAQIPDC